MSQSYIAKHLSKESKESILVHVLLSASTLSSSFSLPIEMLCAATERARTQLQDRADRAKHQIQIQLVAERQGHYPCHAGLSFSADLSAAAATEQTPDLI